MTTPSKDRLIEPKPAADAKAEATPRRLPTPAELLARGWTMAPSTGKGYGLPLHGPRPKKAPK